MLQQVYADPNRVSHLLAGPLGSHISTFVDTELGEGFASLTLQEHLRVLGKLNHWMRQHRVPVSSLTEKHIERFLQERIPSRPKKRSCCQHVLSRFLDHLRSTGIAPPVKRQVSKRSSAMERLLDQFVRHLTHARGLSQSTITRYRSLVHHCVTRHCGQDASLLMLRRLRSADVMTWVRETAQRRPPGRAQELVGALRAFFRWLDARGVVPTGLALAVPTVATWRLRSVPPVLTPAQTRRVLLTCDRSTAMGLRDYAILILLARLGLRASEIVSLRLNDLDWRTGTIHVRRKGGRSDVLPLPPDVGQALARYIQHARPRCSERHVFLCMPAPHRGLGHASTVSSIVAAALRRGGLAPSRRGAHLLRHTLASSLLRRGAPLTEIAQLLGHRSLASTEVYAKVDITGLRTVAAPWPGGV